MVLVVFISYAGREVVGQVPLLMILLASTRLAVRQSL